MQPVSIDTLKPPTEPLDGKYYNLLFANNALPFSPTERIQIVIDYQKITDSICPDTILSMAFLEGLMHVASETELYNINPEIQLIPYSKRFKSKKIPDSKQLQKISENEENDILIILNELTISPNIEIYANPGNYEAVTTILTKAIILTYDSSKKSISSKKRVYDTAQYHYIDYNYYTVFEVASDYIPSLVDAVYYAGREYGNKIFPYWKSEKRYFYCDKDIEMKRAELFALNGDWKNAAAIWQKISSDNSQKLFPKAAFNMALAAEISGDLNDAILWLDRAAEKSDDIQIKLYREILEKRVEQVKKIEQQFIIND